MPDPKNSSPIKQSFLHRLGLRKWLARENYRHNHSNPSKPPGPLPPPLPLPLAAPPPLIEPPRPTERPSYDNTDVIENCDTECSASPLPRGSVDHIDLSSSAYAAFKGQDSERRGLLAPDTEKNQKSHRRATSAHDRRPVGLHRTISPEGVSANRSSAPNLQWDGSNGNPGESFVNNIPPPPGDCDPGTFIDNVSGDGEDFQQMLQLELDQKWILNLSLRFPDKPEREKFFVTYAETPSCWRKVTVTCDYANAERESLERDLKELRYHRDKNCRIYESIRECLDEIQFHDTVTNLTLETIEGRLHVHVSEDVGEIISYPPISSVAHLNPVLIPESELVLHSHLSGFVYHVKLSGQDYVKKEITAPDTVEEFLYEINALHALLESDCVIKFKCILVDDSATLVKGLLLEYASKGSLADLFFDFKGAIAWARKERWARQIIKGLADIHEAGFVQGDFTVSNVVVDGNDDARIIDINRRGCPIGWEPPEFTKKIESKQKISMYIGVKSDLFQLGMTLWAMAVEEDEPGLRPRPLTIPNDLKIPGYFRNIVHICLSPRPQNRLSARELLTLFPEDPSNHAAETLLEYPEQDSGNFITTQKYDIVDPVFHHHQHHDFGQQPADSIYVDSLPNSNPSFDGAIQIHTVSALSTTPVARTHEAFLPHGTDSHNTIPQDEFSLSLPADDPYSLEDITLSLELEDSYLTLEEMAQYGLGPPNSRNTPSDQSLLNTGSFPVEREMPLGSPESGSPVECARLFPSDVKELPEALTGVGDHMSYSFPDSLIPNHGDFKIQRVSFNSNLLSGVDTEKRTTDIKEAADDGVNLDNKPCYEAVTQASYALDPDDLLSSGLSINTAFMSCSTTRDDHHADIHDIPNYISANQDRISPTPSDTCVLCSDDLLASRLPIDTCYDDAEPYPQPPSPDGNSLISSQLPINPAFIPPLQPEPQSKYPLDSDIPSSHCIKLELEQCSELPADDLFASKLPLNPAYNSRA
ncbi:hypothetical protein PRK78_005071 [Emydomyces testavorans]|uniref:Protein kinase domain-containing protein n=1 Tax=Emydomyces testavorans TaxID=2070801 RepID=A0AAF0DJ51_9EURO|nr:hypothetical protein PRK78_005071 [Emydomyces testavorans]